MRVDIEVEGHVVVIRPTGEELNADNVDLLTEALRKVLHEQGKKCDVVLDLGQVGFMTSSVLGALAKVKDQYRFMNTALALCRPSRIILHVLKCLNLDLTFPVYEDLQQAIKHVRPPNVRLESGVGIETLCAATDCKHYHHRDEEPAELCVHPRHPDIEDTRRCPFYKKQTTPATAGDSFGSFDDIDFSELQNVESMEPLDEDAFAPPAKEMEAAPAAQAPPPATESAEPAPAPAEEPAIAPHPETPAGVVKTFVESVNTKDWRAAYDALARELSPSSFEEYRLNREQYYKKMCTSGQPPEQYLLRVEVCEDETDRAYLRCTRVDVSGWGRKEYRQDYALEKRDGQWLITRFSTGGRSGRDRRNRRRGGDERRFLRNPES